MLTLANENDVLPDLEFVLLFTTNPAPRGSLDSVNKTGSWQLVAGASGVVQHTECDDPQATRDIRWPSRP